MIGGPYDDGGVGAVWVWTRGGAVWTQQGSKLVGSNAIGPAQQGTSVSLSGDGMLAVVGGPNDNNGQPGAVWIWARTGDAWVQRGEKLVGSGDAGAAHQGKSVALSRDGTTFVVGGPADNAGAGAAWVFSSYSVPAISPWQLIMLAGVLALLGILRIRV